MQTYRVFALLLQLLGLRPGPFPQTSDENVCGLYNPPQWDVLHGPRQSTASVDGNNAGAGGHWRRRAWTWAVLLLLSVRPLAFTLLSTMYGNAMDCGALCFMWLVPIQYAQAWQYLRHAHVDMHWMRCSGAAQHPWFGVDPGARRSTSSPDQTMWFGVTRMEPFRGIRARQYVLSHVPGLTSLVLLLASTCFVLFLNDHELESSYIPFFGTSFGAWQTPALQAAGRALTVVDTVFGRVTQMLNVGMFIMVFCHHIEDMACLEDIFDLPPDHFDMKKLIQRVAETKACLQHSTALLHDIFTSSSILGGMALALCMQTPQRMPPYLIFCCAVYASVQLLFFLMVRYLAHRRQVLLERMYSLEFTQRCLCPSTGQTNTNKECSLDWMTLTRLLEQQWAQFTLCGVDLQDGQLVTRCAWLVGLVLSSRYL